MIRCRLLVRTLLGLSLPLAWSASPAWAQVAADRKDGAASKGGDPDDRPPAPA